MTVPEPLTPLGCDLTDFSFMPLDVARLRDSELASNETPASCWAAVLLWAASWHQIPAGSIPNNDLWIAGQAGYARRGKVDREWKDVRDGAMRGFIECSDGRLYHATVCEKAREAWASKLDQRWRTECARIKKHADRWDIVLPRPSFDAWLSMGCPVGVRLPVPGDDGVVSRGTAQGQQPNVPRETASKGQGEGQEQGEGQGQGDSLKPFGPAASSPPPLPGSPPPPPAADAPATKGARLKVDWALPRAWGEWALLKYPHWTADIVRDLATQFHNHWKGKSGKDATKLDWYATWQNWCMSLIAQRQYPPPKAVLSDESEARRIADLAAETRRHLGFQAPATTSSPEVIDQ